MVAQESKSSARSMKAHNRYTIEHNWKCHFQLEIRSKMIPSRWIPSTVVSGPGLWTSDCLCCITLPLLWSSENPINFSPYECCTTYWINSLHEPDFGQIWFAQTYSSFLTDTWIYALLGIHGYCWCQNNLLRQSYLSSWSYAVLHST